MGVSFWAKWSCSEPVADLRNLILPLVLAEGYDLLAWHRDRQVFDRGGIETRLAWGLTAGRRWSDSPTVLTVSYARQQDQSQMTFHWELSVRPVPATQEDKASFEEWVRSQMGRVIGGLRHHLETARELTLSDQATIELVSQAEQVKTSKERADADPRAGTRVAAVLEAVGTRLEQVHYAEAVYETTPVCDQCQQPALPVPGTAGRYHCLQCRRVLGRQPIA